MRIGQARSLRPCWYVFRELSVGGVEYIKTPTGRRNRKFFSEAAADAAVERSNRKG